MTLAELDIKLNEALSDQSLSESAKKCRDLLELCIDFIYQKAGIEKPKSANLLELLDSDVVNDYIDDTEIICSMHYVRKVGSHTQQGRSVRKKEVKTSQDNISYLVGLIKAKETDNIDNYQKPPYMSEAATRRIYVDTYLREAGWEVLDKEDVIQPEKACIEIKVEGMPNPTGIGYCDYVLYGRDAKPLAVVEVKKTSESAEKGRHQVNLYADCLQAKYGYRPIIYYTNGYITKIIDGVYADRDVIAFHSMDELERMIQRRNRGDITDLRINEEITDRPYQMIAITKICEKFNAKRRRGLLVMATGTGKTRVAISMVDVLARNGWVKNVLFLADRTALVNQAKKKFEKYLPDMTVCELSAGGKDYNARLMFSTYQTMINYIDAEEKLFTTGRFDLIIIDEAHRSIFNKYGTIFRYFDSLLVGLTATPKDEVDANTYEIFKCEPGEPTYDYTLQEAIDAEFLVGYKVISRTSDLIANGIDLSKLSQDQLEQFDDYLADDPPTPDFNIPGNEIFKYLYNKDTCRKVIEDLMRWGLRVDGGETLGKTIIFAYNHKHAQMIVECFRDLYPEYTNYCQLIDCQEKYADNLIIKFEENDDFRIAVSVDMLDTGVDIEPILNLVFFKKVRSKIKFVQMIGRGTRLCPDLYGPGKDKSGFLIFDYCANFEYFGEHPDGKQGVESYTLSQKLFNIRVDMLTSLQKYEHQQNQRLLIYYNAIKAELLSKVSGIKNHHKRIRVREEMQYVDKYNDVKTWESLSPVMIKEVKKHISPLLDSGLNGDHLSVAFDIRVYYVENDLLNTGTLNNSGANIKLLRQIAQYLINEKASIPQVRNKINELKELMGDEIWANPNIEKLEKLRISLRDLMQYLKDKVRHKFDIDIPDNIEDAEYQPEDTVIDIRTYREKVIDYLIEHSDSPVIQKIYNLEPINNDDLKELEKVLWHELGTQEEYTKSTSILNLAAFIRSLVGLNQDAVNKKFGEYLNSNTFNSQQQEFIHTIINYVRENGDIELSDIVNTEPFNNYDINEMFGTNINAVVEIVNVLHGSVTTDVA